MKKLYCLITLLIISASSYATTRVKAKVERVFSEANQFTFEVKDNDVAHPCNGVWYRALRADTPHFSEMYSLVLTAFTSQKNVEIIIRDGQCSGDIAIIDHIGIY